MALGIPLSCMISIVTEKLTNKDLFLRVSSV